MNKKGIFSIALAFGVTLLIAVISYAMVNNSVKTHDETVGLAGFSVIEAETDYNLELLKIEKKLEGTSDFVLLNLFNNGGFLDNTEQRQIYNGNYYTLWGKGCGAGLNYRMMSEDAMIESYEVELRKQLIPAFPDYPYFHLIINEGLELDMGDYYIKSYSREDFEFEYRNGFEVASEFHEFLFRRAGNFMSDLRSCTGSRNCLISYASESDGDMFYFEKDLGMGFALRGLVDFNPVGPGQNFPC